VVEEVAAEGQLECAYALLDAANHNLDHTILIAPHDGVVSTINGTIGGPPGDPINIAPGAGAGASGIFIQLVDLNDIQQIEAYVKESDIERVEIGQKVQFTVRAYGTHIFSGTVSELLSNGLASTESPNGLTTPNDITFPIIVNIDPQSDKGMHLLPNMTANATITLEDNPQALLVPASAVTFAQSASTGQAALISQQQVNVAKIRAQSMLTQMENRSPNIAALWPQATYVLERANDGHSLKAVPVILELGTNGTYKVLAGLQQGDNVVINAPSRSPNTKIIPALHSHTH
jgi:multidrug efflux pump subunit AcrA (membrane-fusion protein)